MKERAHPIFSNTIYNIINTAISFVIAYAMTPVILGRLGSEDYGIWVFLSIFTVTGYFSLLDLGFQGAATKYVAEYLSKKDYGKLQDIVNSILFFFLAAGFIGAIILFVLNFFFLETFFNLPSGKIQTISLLINITAFSFLFQFPALGYSAIIQGLQKYGYLRGVTIFTTILSNAILFIYLNQNNGIVFLIIVTLATALLVTLLYAWITKKILPSIKLSFFSIKKYSFKLLFSLSSKLFASRIVGLIFNNTDKILIGIFLTVNNQTEYDIVNKLHIVLLSLLSIINQVVLPATSEFAAKHDTSKLKTILIRSTKYSSVLVLPALLLLTIFPYEIVSVWVGDSYSNLGNLVRLYSVHIFFTMLVGVSSTMFVGINQVEKVLKISIFAALLNLVISISTVNTLGIKGLIVATVISYIISSIVYIFVANKTFYIKNKEFFKQTILPLLPATILIATGMLILKPFMQSVSIVTWMGFSIMIYLLFFGIFSITGLQPEEKSYLKHFFTQFTTKFKS
jgi:O-antigen/teichoic acid export membrane protein